MDMMTQQLVAVKKQALPDQAAERELCLHCMLQRFPHANVVAMLDYFVVDESARAHLCIVMPLCDSSLSMMAKLGPVQAQSVATHCQGLLSAVAHLHRLGIVHGDISLASCLLDRAGQVPGCGGLVPGCGAGAFRCNLAASCRDAGREHFVVIGRPRAGMWGGCISL